MATQLPATNPDLVQLIASIPALSGHDWAVSPLTNGLTNRNYLLESGVDRVVLRQNSTAVPGVDRAREARVLQQVAMRGLAPMVVACDPQAGYLVTEFVEDAGWSSNNTSQPERLTALGKYLRNLHEVPVEEIGSLNVERELEHYWSLDQLKALPELERIRGGANNLLLELHGNGWFEQRPGLCHHDLTHSNIFGDYAITMIDWEFAAAGNPLLDLGMFISYHDLTYDIAAPLIEAYFGSMLPDVLQRLSQASRLAQLLELLWLASREDLPRSAQQRLSQLLLVWS